MLHEPRGTYETFTLATRLSCAVNNTIGIESTVWIPMKSRFALNYYARGIFVHTRKVGRYDPAYSHLVDRISPLVCNVYDLAFVHRYLYMTGKVENDAVMPASYGCRMLPGELCPELLGHYDHLFSLGNH